MENQLISNDLSGEEYREYHFGKGGDHWVHRIDGPKTLYRRSGGTTHRVLDAEGLVHIVPCIGPMGCVVTFKPRDSANPVQF
jgi:hypothetical protein